MLSLNAPAKINLHLEVGLPRADGYHPLRTIFQQISLCDSLRFTITDGPLRLRLSDSKKPADPRFLTDNLVIRALALLKTRFKIKKGMDVVLTKRIPVGAGLGGGSSDAAAALKAGVRLWKIPKVAQRLPKIARELGADVPFFLKGGTAWAEGVGERLAPIPAAQKRWLMLVHPRVHVSTPKAYGLLDSDRTTLRTYTWASKKPTASDWATSFRGFNSFEKTILSAYPTIQNVKEWLMNAGCTGVMMSGSGSAVYGFVSSPVQGRNLMRKIKSKPWDAFLVHTGV